ncbi:MAG: hypothetical protein QW235_00670 [Pyrobaculum sp.]
MKITELTYIREIKSKMVYLYARLLYSMEKKGIVTTCEVKKIYDKASKWCTPKLSRRSWRY